MDSSLSSPSPPNSDDEDHATAMGLSRAKSDANQPMRHTAAAKTKSAPQTSFFPPTPSPSVPSDDDETPEPVVTKMRASLPQQHPRNLQAQKDISRRSAPTSMSNGFVPHRIVEVKSGVVSREVKEPVAPEVKPRAGIPSVRNSHVSVSVTKEPASKEPMQKEPVRKEPVRKERILEETKKEGNMQKEVAPKEQVQKVQVQQESEEKEPVEQGETRKAALAVAPVSAELKPPTTVKKSPVSAVEKPPARKVEKEIVIASKPDGSVEKPDKKSESPILAAAEPKESSESGGSRNTSSAAKKASEEVKFRAIYNKHLKSQIRLDKSSTSDDSFSEAEQPSPVKRRPGSRSRRRRKSKSPAKQRPSLLPRKHKGVLKRKRVWNNVLFYGDSLTWGMAHNYTGRYKITWPRLLKDKLELYNLVPVESALCSRTTCWDDNSPNDEWMNGAEPHFFNGLRHFYAEFMSCTPTWVVILLGTNDLRVAVRKEAKRRTRIDASEIAKNCAKVALRAREAHKGSPFAADELNIMLVAPPKVCLNELSKQLGYDESSVTIAADLSRAYEEVCTANGFLFAQAEIDMAKSVDGIHITEDANNAIAEGVWKVMADVLGAPPKGTPTTIVKKKPAKARRAIRDGLTLKKRKKLKKLKKMKKLKRRLKTGVKRKRSNKVKEESGKVETIAPKVKRAKTVVKMKTLKEEEQASRFRDFKERKATERFVVDFFCRLQQELPIAFKSIVQKIVSLQGKGAAVVEKTMEEVRKELLKSPLLRSLFDTIYKFNAKKDFIKQEKVDGTTKLTVKVHSA